MMFSLPTSSISESSMAGWRHRFDYIGGGSLERDAIEELGSGTGILWLNQGRSLHGFPQGLGGDDQPPNVDAARSVPGVLEVVSFLGRGSFGEVWECQVVDRNERVAVKVLKSSRNDQQLTRECQLLSALQHTNLVQLFKAIQGPPTSALVMELCPGGTLAQLVHAEATREAFLSLSLRARVRAALDVASCLAYLHGNGVLHRDIKTSNCLLSRPHEAGSEELPQIKVADLGLAREEAEQMSQKVGTMIYMAPELMEGEEYSFPVDVYSTAMLLYELSSGFFPFSTSDQRLQNDVAFILAVATMAERPRLDDLPKGDTTSEAIRAILQAAWAEEPTSRPSAAEFADQLHAL